MTEFKLTENTVVDVASLCLQNAEIKTLVKLQQFKRVATIASNSDSLINIELSFTKHNVGNVLSTKVSAELTFVCQRCLDEVKLNLASQTDYLLVKSAPFAQKVNFEVVLVEDSNLQLYDLLEDELLLAIPHVITHDDCNLPNFTNPINNEFISSNKINPFAVLAQLKN